MSAPPTQLDALEWRYLSSRSHAVHGFTRAPTGNATARCGVMPAWFSYSGWLGTGTQNEYERAAALPRCKRCVRLFTDDHGGPAKLAVLRSATRRSGD